MSITDELRRVDEMMEGWAYCGLLTSAAERIEALTVENTQLKEEIAELERDANSEVAALEAQIESQRDTIRHLGGGG